MREYMIERYINQIEMTINRQYSGCCRLVAPEVQDKEGQKQFLFGNEEIQAAVTIENRNNILTGRISLSLKSEAFRQNDHLTMEQPVTIRIKVNEQPKRMTAMHLHRDWWTRPAFIDSFNAVPERTQVMYIDYKDRKGFVLFMAGDRYKTMGRGGDNGWLTMEMTSYMAGARQIDETLFVITEAPDIYEAAKKAFEMAAREKGVPLKKDKIYPEIFEYLGWCSWDAFYTDISEEKVRQKAKELADKQIPVRWMLMDDGWLSVRGQQLYDFGPEKQKFPDGFRKMIDDIRTHSTIDWFGVWHALGGYWGGIDPASDLAMKEKDNLYQTIDDKLIPYPDAGKSYNFYKKWYTALRREGIDFVKVDGQSAVKNYFANHLPVCSAARGMHEGLEGAAAAWLNGRLINCMGMAMENIWARPGSALSRNSDDFVPDNVDGFAEHLLQNTYNAVYHEEMYYCDWDMFWTSHSDSVKHGILRAISGGPVYISDRIGETSREALIPLAYDDGRLLRMERTARPSADCLFTDPIKSGVVKLTNVAACGQLAKAGAIAVYNLGKEERQYTVSPKDIYDLPQTSYYVYDYLQQQGVILNYEEVQNRHLPADQCILYLLLPIIKGIAVIGLIDKYMSFHGIETLVTSENGLLLSLKQGGRFGFFSQELVSTLRVNGREVIDLVAVNDGLYIVDTDASGSVMIEIGK